MNAHDPDWPGCQHEMTGVNDRGETAWRYCSHPKMAGEQFCARHGGKHKTKRVPLYKRWITASVKRLAKLLGKR